MSSLVLASASPRRQALIALLGLPFRVMVADVDEQLFAHLPPARYVQETARQKAEAVGQLLKSGEVVVAADTTVAIDEQILGKPEDLGVAREMLRQLRGRVHQVHTGIVVWHTGTGQIVADIATIDVPMRAYGDEEIEIYLATGDPLDKAGGYAIQHAQFQPVVELTGCYAGVVGLPLCHLTRALWRVGVPASSAIANHCQQYHQYHCPLHPSILQIS